MKVLDFVQGTATDRVIQVHQEAALAYLKAKYPDFNTSDEANLLWWADASKKVARNSANAWDKLQRYDSNSVLRRHPDTLRLAKQFALLEAFYGSTVGVAGSFDVFRPAAPL